MSTFCRLILFVKIRWGPKITEIDWVNAFWMKWYYSLKIVCQNGTRTAKIHTFWSCVLSPKWVSLIRIRSLKYFLSQWNNLSFITMTVKNIYALVRLNDRVVIWNGINRNQIEVHVCIQSYNHIVACIKLAIAFVHFAHTHTHW